MDTEKQIPANDEPEPNRLVRVGRVPLPLRAGHVISDILKIALVLTVSAYGQWCPPYQYSLTSLAIDASPSSTGY
jgi:hypothetical protein